jgi:hypothetical protein
LRTISFPLRFLKSIFVWTIWMMLIYLLFYYIKEQTHFPDIITICLYTPLFLILYAGWEYIFSKRLLTR